IRQLITAGLSTDLALAGLTKNAATIAGVGRRLGTLEPGKLGHLIVMTAPFSDEKAKGRYVLIDGLKFQIKPEDRARTKGRTGGPDGSAAEREAGERPGQVGRAGPGGRRPRGEGAETKDAPKQKGGSDAPGGSGPDRSTLAGRDRRTEQTPTPNGDQRS